MLNTEFVLKILDYMNLPLDLQESVIDYARLSVMPRLDERSSDRLAKILALTEKYPGLDLILSEINQELMPEVNYEVLREKIPLPTIECNEQMRCLASSSLIESEETGYHSSEVEDLARLYATLSNQSTLSEREARQISEILMLAESNSDLALLLSEVDQILFEATEGWTEETLHDYADQTARILEFVAPSISTDQSEELIDVLSSQCAELIVPRYQLTLLIHRNESAMLQSHPEPNLKSSPASRLNHLMAGAFSRWKSIGASAIVLFAGVALAPELSKAGRAFFSFIPYVPPQSEQLRGLSQHSSIAPHAAKLVSDSINPGGTGDGTLEYISGEQSVTLQSASQSGLLALQTSEEQQQVDTEREQVKAEQRQLVAERNQIVAERQNRYEEAQYWHQEAHHNLVLSKRMRAKAKAQLENSQQTLALMQSLAPVSQTIPRIQHSQTIENTMRGCVVFAIALTGFLLVTMLCFVFFPSFTSARRRSLN